MVEYFNFLNTNYNIGQFWSAYLMLGITLFLVLISCIIRKYFRKDFPLVRFIIMAGFMFIWVSVALFTSINEYITFKKALIENKYQVVEGYVENFNPMPYEGHQSESFKVKGIKFEYSDYVSTYAFHNSKSHGGPIDEGKYVKIYYFEGKILRLWVKK
jgi:hypothetical protein